MVKRGKGNSAEDAEAFERNSARGARIRATRDWREQIFTLVEPFAGKDRASKTYDRVMATMVVLSFIPLFFHDETIWPLALINSVCALAFSVDYILRFVTADRRYRMQFPAAGARYIFSPTAIIDLLTILSLTTPVNSSFRLLASLRLVRVLKIFRYSRSLQVVKVVLRRSSKSISIVAAIALAYALVSALVMFNVEPETFQSFFDAMYWSIVSLTTVGYGDIVPVTTAGQMVMMVSALVGIAVVALPAGIITGEYVSELNRKYYQRGLSAEKKEIEEEVEEKVEREMKRSVRAEVKKDLEEK